MRRFPSTDLVRQLATVDIQKADLDLLDKINRLVDDYNAHVQPWARIQFLTELDELADTDEDDWHPVFDVSAEIYKRHHVPYWRKVTNPSTGWFDSQTTFTADRFNEADGGMTVDFTADPNWMAGARAVLVYMLFDTTAGHVYGRAAGDSNISNTPDASSEYSARIGYGTTAGPPQVLWLSSSGQADIAVANSGTDVYVAYPKGYLL